ncbi:MAG: N-6 DNA methylase, partial [Campylobacterota bacterium]|nr:N-6 DNA methylase [Campylobacterota bacterium]
MALFQNSVLRNYLHHRDKDIALQAYELYKQTFLPKITNIKISKEEQYQYGFLDDLFVKVLGYRLNPTPDYNLIAEQKNLSDSKKADGAVLKDGKVIAVIELKSTKTKSMEKIVNQAFNYKHNHPTCKYIITSNFEKLRFYVEHSDKYEEFNLFELNQERFVLLYALLSKESIFDDEALTLKNQSKLQEENISHELYKKYATLRTNLFENIIQNNPHIDKLILLEKTQTILDRMVFIFFGEDRGILPANTIKSIIDHHDGDIEDRELWHFYKIYFSAINKGNAKLKIPEYNGGLFAEDALLDSLIIDKNVLDASPLMLSAYDFNSDIDVNILGHIFENSLNDIEELKARIEDTDFDVKHSKRKKDGVFYTPEYITKYIVDNTLGRLCQAKKEELGLDDVDIVLPKNPKKLNKGEERQKEALEAYRVYLLGLKILDPACGSGAFLNQTLNYLLAEHAFIDESIKTLMGGSVLGLYDVKKGILENNLYGVDINAEAVEIAKLSLWLRTVESGRKLNKLADKIKVANSLLNMPFKEESFDIVIGNPPYVRQEMIKEFKPALKEKYQTFVGTA